MKPLNIDKSYDVISIGNICRHKRPLKIQDLPGKKKIWLGFKKQDWFVSRLIKGNVTVLDFVQYSELARYYNMSKLCYIPCTLHGGGERAVLEARACGVPVKIEPDNLKLKEMLDSEIYTSIYYADQIHKGITQV